MIKEGKFGTQEAVWLSTIVITAKVFYSSPAVIASILGNTGWYMTLISATTALIAFLFICRLLRRFPDMELTEIFDASMGKVLGFTFSMILCIYMLFLGSTSIAEFHEVMNVYVFPNSPAWYLNLIFVLSVAVFSILGLESMARMAKIISFFAVSGFIAVIVLGSQNYHITNLFPIFGYGLDKTALHGVLRSSAYGEILILAIFAKSFQGTKYIKKAGVLALILSGAVISTSILAFTLAFPYYTSQEITAPMYQLATLIDYGRFIQRIEPIFLFIWIISSLLSTTVVFYSFIWMFCKLFRIQDKKPIILAGSVLLFTSSFMHKDITSIILGGVQYSRMFGNVPLFLLPVIALITAFIRKKGGNKVA